MFRADKTSMFSATKATLALRFLLMYSKLIFKAAIVKFIQRGDTHTHSPKKQGHTLCSLLLPCAIVRWAIGHVRACPSRPPNRWTIKTFIKLLPALVCTIRLPDYLIFNWLFCFFFLHLLLDWRLWFHTQKLSWWNDIRKERLTIASWGGKHYYKRGSDEASWFGMVISEVICKEISHGFTNPLIIGSFRNFYTKRHMTTYCPFKIHRRESKSARQI